MIIKVTSILAMIGTVFWFLWTPNGEEWKLDLEPIVVFIMTIGAYFTPNLRDLIKNTKPIKMATDGSIIQDNSGGSNIANTGSGTINIGITLEEYEAGLKNREVEVRAELNLKHTKDRQALEIELQNIQQLLQDSKASYKARIASLKKRLTHLEALRGQFPDAIIDKAKNALAQGHSQQADQLFQRIERQADSIVIVVAEAAYQRGNIAEDDIRYLKAFAHFQKAIRFVPDNALYLNQAGSMASTLARYTEAISYYDQALASDLNTYDEDHPDVARDRNNLGGAWQSLGKYQKAISYYEQALVTLEKKLGKDHPTAQLFLGNLEGVRNEMARSANK